MRQAHEADFQGIDGLVDAVKDEIELRRILQNPLFWKLVVGLIAGITILTTFFSVRRANKSMPPDQDDYDYNRVAPDKMTQDEMLEQVKRRNRLDRHQANRSA
jgi:hypothetical protein